MIIEITHGIKSSFLSHVFSNAGMGYVHSIFENSFNVLFQGQMIHFGKEHTGISAFGVLLPSEQMKGMLADLQVEDRVKFQAGSLTFYNRKHLWKVKTSSFETVDCRVPEILELKEEFLSLLLEKFVLLNLESKIGVLAAKEDERLVVRFLESDWDEELFQSSFMKHFIGRGIGLTPSGDDFLMGILMLVKASGHAEGWQEILVRQLEERKSTEVSMAYYQALLDGYTSSYFVDFLKMLQLQNLYSWDELIQAISYYGHTSGWDTLYGIYIAIKKIYDEKQSNEI